MADTTPESGWVKDLAHETFQACLAFYDKNPVIGSLGFLLLLSSLPLYIILRHTSKMKRVDNDLIVAKLSLELKKSSSKLKGKKGKSSKAASTAASANPSTTTAAGG
ncbi:hypothetical protein [uncultured Pantoea sp.]|uniref:hypothetical protein n=1 Tax=uncultured Pantoea sp. TaxID=218084 RepID=UPI00258D76F9|nr:hypothetical protein [uncultured Pantoea sp.]